MRGYSVTLLDGKGNRLPQQLLHHVNLMVKNRRDLFANIMLRIGAAGPETGPVHLPRFLGLPVTQGDTLVVNCMLRSTGSPGGDVTLRIDLPFTRRSSRIGAVPIYPISIAIGPAGRPNLFDLPPGRSSHSWEGSPSIPGRILGLSGHMPQYGVSLRLEDRTGGKVLWEAFAENEEMTATLRIPRSHFLWPFGAVIRPDHVYRFTAVYENPSGRTIQSGGMGVLGGVMTIARSTVWPSIDPHDPAYLADVRDIFSDAALHPEHGDLRHTRGTGVITPSAR
jgi:hypothetical protein